MKLKINLASATEVRLFVFLTLSFCGLSTAQHRGDNLSFQGLTSSEYIGVKASALAGAFTARSGDVSSLYWNPAGLWEVKDLQIFASGSFFSKSWRENQNYRPNRFFVTLPFYLEGLYVPDPANNWRYDHLIARDTAIFYTVKEPELGLDPFSKEAADWTKSMNGFKFSNISAALPFTIEDERFVAAIGFNQQINILDFDRNDTYLDPHPGYNLYGEMSRVNGVDTAVMNWSRYYRERTGDIYSINGALSYDMNKYVKLGLGLKISWGSSSDLLYLNRVGTFHLIKENQFKFAYTTDYKELKGTSDYNSTAFNLGFLFTIDRVALGVKIDLPFTMTRRWEYDETAYDSTNSSSRNISGSDEVKIPAIITAGLSVTPIDDCTISLDYEYAPFSKAEFNLASPDSLFMKWVDKKHFRVGIEYRILDYISLMAGFRYDPTVFVPDGAAYDDRGPEASVYTFGSSLEFFFGRVDFAYEYSNLKYYDSYFSNTNYVFESMSTFKMGYTYSF